MISRLTFTLLAFLYLGGVASPFASAAPPPTVTGDLPSFIAEAKRLSDTPGGKRYEEAFSTAVAQPFADAMRACTANTKPPFTFDLVFIVSAEGRVASVTHTPEQPVADCVATKLRGVGVPRPPHDSWPVHIHMNVQR